MEIKNHKHFFVVILIVIIIISGLISIFLIQNFKTKVKIVWKYKLNRVVNLTPVIYQDQVITATRDILYSIDSNTGEKKWEMKLDQEISELSQLNKNKIYIVTKFVMKFTETYKNISIYPILYCIDLDTNKILWKLNDINISGVIESLNGSYVNGNIVYFKDDTMAYINGDTGKLIWEDKIKDLKQNLSEAEISLIKNKIYHCTDEGLVCINLDTHELIWKTNYLILSHFIVSNDRIYADSRDNNFYCINRNNGTLIWKYNIENDTGKERLGCSAPFLHKDKIYIGGDYANNYIFCLNSENGELIWKYKTGDIVTTSPYAINNQLYAASSDTYLYCLNSENGALVWKAEVGSLFSSPVLKENKIFIGSLSKRCLYCLEERR